MKKELQNKIFEKYPILYQQHILSKQESCMYWGIDCGDGWYDLIDELSDKIERYNCEVPKMQKQWWRRILKHAYYILTYKINNLQFAYKYRSKLYYAIRKQKNYYNSMIRDFVDPRQVEACQVKEKYGVLHYYTNMNNSKIDKLIAEAEDKSATICERCGSTDNVTSPKGWISYTCQKCKLADKIKEYC